MSKKIGLAIDLAVSLIRTAKFIGIDEYSQSVLQEFVAELDDDELDELKEKESLADLKNLSTLFDKKYHEASHVLFELEVPAKSSDALSLNGLSVIGPISRSTVMTGEYAESDSIVYPGVCSVYLICEIDHDAASLIEKYAHKMKGAKFEFSVQAEFPFKIVKKTFI